MTDSRGLSPHSTCRTGGRSLTSYKIYPYYTTCRSVCKERIFPVPFEIMIGGIKHR